MLFIRGEVATRCTAKGRYMVLLSLVMTWNGHQELKQVGIDALTEKVLPVLVDFVGDDLIGVFQDQYSVVDAAVPVDRDATV